MAKKHHNRKVAVDRGDLHVAAMRGMYLEVVIKDNKDSGETIVRVDTIRGVGEVENEIRRKVRTYLRSVPLAPPKGFYSLLVMPRWVEVK